MRWWVSLVAGLAACADAGAPGGGGGSVSDDGGTVSPTDTGTPTGGPLGYAADIAPVFARNCAPCHVDGGRSGGLNLDRGPEALVGVASDQLPSMDLVAPGSSDDSYLWHKLDGTHRAVGGSGDAMPDGGDLTNRQLNDVERWIDEGALP